MIIHKLLSPLPPPLTPPFVKGVKPGFFLKLWGGGQKGEIQCLVAVQCGELVEALFSILNELQK